MAFAMSMVWLRYSVDSGQVYYSTDELHYNDPYGYFVPSVDSCAGCARVTGLYVGAEPAPYEHPLTAD